MLLKWGYNHCGGTLIGDKYVITAAHCTEGLPTEALTVVVGDTTLDIPDDSVSFVAKIIRSTHHPDIDFETLKNDIAVLELAEAVNLTAYPHIKPACLPYQSQVSDFINKTAVVTGWGALRYGRTYPTHLQKVNVDVLGRTNCGSYSAELEDSITEDMFCAGYLEGGKDSCSGDSGGPLVTKDPNNNEALTLIGVVSWGVGCAIKNYPGVYTDVPYFMQNGWLSQQLPNLQTCPPPPSTTETTEPTECPDMPNTSYLRYTRIGPDTLVQDTEECKNLCKGK